MAGSSGSGGRGGCGRHCRQAQPDGRNGGRCRWRRAWGGAGGTPPDAVTNLAASVTNRRRVTMRLAWTVPATGSTVAGYDMRYAKVPITAANFDDASVRPPLRTPGPRPLRGRPTASMSLPCISRRTTTSRWRPRVPAAPAARSRRRRRRTGRRSWSRSSRASRPPTIGTGRRRFGRLRPPGGVEFTADGLSDLLVGTNSGGRAYCSWGPPRVTRRRRP